MTVKGRGFLLNRGTECFSGRIVSVGGLFTPAQLHAIAECAEQFGSGKVIFTSRLAAEIAGIPFEKIEEAERLGAAIDRIGTEKLEADLATADLLDRKEEILAKPILHR